VKIIFTKHAEEKFLKLENEGWKFSPKDIKETVKDPYFSEIDREREVIIALKRWDQSHDLRVIYRKENDIIMVITFYPAEKGRYLK